MSLFLLSDSTRRYFLEVIVVSDVLVSALHEKLLFDVKLLQHVLKQIIPKIQITAIKISIDPNNIANNQLFTQFDLKNYRKKDDLFIC